MASDYIMARPNISSKPHSFGPAPYPPVFVVSAHGPSYCMPSLDQGIPGIGGLSPHLPTPVQALATLLWSPYPSLRKTCARHREIVPLF